MKEEIKKLWLAALRSGKYNQGQNALRRGNKFCCLGVLCDLHAKETSGKWRRMKVYLGGSVVLPTEVCVWAGLREPNPLAKTEDLSSSLVELNDGGWSFSEIADIIEKEIPGDSDE